MNANSDSQIFTETLMILGSSFKQTHWLLEPRLIKWIIIIINQMTRAEEIEAKHEDTCSYVVI